MFSKGNASYKMQTNNRLSIDSSPIKNYDENINNNNDDDDDDNKTTGDLVLTYFCRESFSPVMSKPLKLYMIPRV